MEKIEGKEQGGKHGNKKLVFELAPSRGSRFPLTGEFGQIIQKSSFVFHGSLRHSSS
jgi:hypothetical protein